MRDEIVARWTSRLEEWRRFNVQVDGATLAAEVLADLQQVAANEGDVALTLSAAADLSGYTTDHLSRLIRDGTIRNAGRKGSPRILRKDLPIRPSRVASGRGAPYNAVADARFLRSPAVRSNH